ncbi:hypothetical protein QBZ16_002338 [Prototheca wickerhamii]|uniref:Glutamate--cysteine ligase n=1 Tax=Prototheca wickerhamii TaxID=3111 RepID=A0AAD9IKF3_PROWI|nr:hypothetical protein QBZ16_002338 [Prototheca wickerhamii]
MAPNGHVNGVSPPLTIEDLVHSLSRGCKPSSKWGIGTEHEKLGYSKAPPHARPTHAQISDMFTRMHESIGWDYIMEGEHKIGLAHGGETVTLEPGGQTELSGAPRRDLHAVAAETRAHLAAVRAAGDAAGIDFMAIGLDPRWAFADIPKMPKTRYRFMREYMPRVGTLGHDMMFRSCTVQVNLDFDSEADMVAKFRVSLALQNSWRLHVWTDVDNDRCGRLPWVFDEGFGFRAYVDWVLDVPMYFLYRDGQYHDVAGQTFRDFFEGRLAGFPGLRPTMDDWELHLTTVFPDVRLKRFLEMRGADGGDWRFILALPALWVGLLYDAQALQESLALTRDWTQKELDHLQREVPRLALQTTFREGTVQDVAKQESGETQADVLLRLYETEWDHSIEPLYTPAFTVDRGLWDDKPSA